MHELPHTVTVSVTVVTGSLSTTWAIPFLGPGKMGSGKAAATPRLQRSAKRPISRMLTMSPSVVAKERQHLATREDLTKRAEEPGRKSRAFPPTLYNRSQTRNPRCPHRHQTTIHVSPLQQRLCISGRMQLCVTYMLAGSDSADGSEACLHFPTGELHVSMSTGTSKPG